VSYKTLLWNDNVYLFWEFNSLPTVPDTSDTGDDYYVPAGGPSTNLLPVDRKGYATANVVLHGSLMLNTPYNRSAGFPGLEYIQGPSDTGGDWNYFTSHTTRWKSFAAELIAACTWPPVVRQDIILCQQYGMWELYLAHIAGSYYLSLNLYPQDGDVTTPVTLTGATPIDIELRHHYACEFSGRSWAVFVDGVEDARFTQGVDFIIRRDFFGDVSPVLAVALRSRWMPAATDFKGVIDSFAFYHNNPGAAKFLAHFNAIDSVTTDVPPAPTGLTETAHTATTVTLAIDPFPDADLVATGSATRHHSTKWQIATDPDFDTIIFDSGYDIVNLVSITANPPLVARTDYYARAAFKDVATRVSNWSTTYNFTTKIKPNKPTFTINQVSQETLTINGSAYVDPDAAPMQALHVQVDYDDLWTFGQSAINNGTVPPQGPLAYPIEHDVVYLTNTPLAVIGNLAVDSGDRNLGGALIWGSVPFAIVHKQVRIAYQDADGLWSDWSDPVTTQLLIGGTADALITERYISKNPLVLLPLITPYQVGAVFQDISGNDRDATITGGGLPGEGGFLSAGGGVVVGFPDTETGPIADVFFPFRAWLGRSLGFTGGLGNWLEIPYGAWMDQDDFAIVVTSQKMNNTALHPICGMIGEPSLGTWQIRWQGTTLIFQFVDNTNTTRTLSVTGITELDRTYFISVRKLGVNVDIFLGDPVAATLTKTSFVLPFAPGVWHNGTLRDLVIGTEAPTAGWHMYGLVNWLGWYPGLSDADVQELWDAFNSLGPDKPTLSVSHITSNSVDLSSSPFSTSDLSTAHKSTSWQIDLLEGDFQTPVWNNIHNLIRLLSYTNANPLAEQTHFKARVRHTDNLNVDGPWSDAVPFTTLRAITTPPDSEIVVTEESRVVPVLYEIESCPPVT
jgi:hypothetical protein